MTPTVPVPLMLARAQWGCGPRAVLAAGAVGPLVALCGPGSRGLARATGVRLPGRQTGAQGR